MRFPPARKPNSRSRKVQRSTCFPCFDSESPSWEFSSRIKTQVQIPDELFHRAKAVAAAREWSFAELVRRGLESMVERSPETPLSSKSGWRLPKPVDLGLRSDPFDTPDWREEANLGAGAARLIF